jgi:hypothetical protein
MSGIKHKSSRTIMWFYGFYMAEENLDEPLKRIRIRESIKRFNTCLSKEPAVGFIRENGNGGGLQWIDK